MVTRQRRLDIRMFRCGNVSTTFDIKMLRCCNVSTTLSQRVNSVGYSKVMFPLGTQRCKDVVTTLDLGRDVSNLLLTLQQRYFPDIITTSLCDNVATLYFGH